MHMLDDWMLGTRGWMSWNQLSEGKRKRARLASCPWGEFDIYGQLTLAGRLGLRGPQERGQVQALQRGLVLEVVSQQEWLGQALASALVLQQVLELELGLAWLRALVLEQVSWWQEPGLALWLVLRQELERRLWERRWPWQVRRLFSSRLR